MDTQENLLFLLHFHSRGLLEEVTRIGRSLWASLHPRMKIWGIESLMKQAQPDGGLAAIQVIPEAGLGGMEGMICAVNCLTQSQ